MEAYFNFLLELLKTFFNIFGLTLICTILFGEVIFVIFSFMPEFIGRLPAKEIRALKKVIIQAIILTLIMALVALLPATVGLISLVLYLAFIGTIFPIFVLLLYWLNKQ